MKIIRLDKIDSTNSFLKEMVDNKQAENYTVVVTNNQTLGKGQINSKWFSQPNKNLTFSVFCFLKEMNVEKQKYLNYAVSLSVIESLKEFKIPKLSIKWPNDILVKKKKICGILIENFLKGNKIDSTIIGIGLNVNQDVFPVYIPNATSLKKILNCNLNLDNLLNLIINKLILYIDLLNEKKYKKLENEFFSQLYRYNKPSMFQNKENGIFMGKIIGVSSQGKLKLELNNGIVNEFGLKEISFL